MKRLLVIVACALCLAAAWWIARAPEERADASADPGTGEVERVIARERAAAHFEAGALADARADLAPLVARDSPELDDLVRAAIVEYAGRPASDPEPLLARIRARAPENPALRYMEARLALERGDFEAARGHFEAALRARPDDRATRAGLASTCIDLGLVDRAQPLLRSVIGLGPERGGVWYAQAVYLSLRLEQELGSEAEVQRLSRLYEELAPRGLRAPSARELDHGDLARLDAPPPRPLAREAAPPPRLPEFVLEPAIAPELAGARELFVHDLDGDGDADLLAAGPRGVQVAWQDASGFAVETVVAGPIDHVRAFDLANRDLLDLVATRGAEVLLLEHESGAELLLGDPRGGRWSPSPLALPAVEGAVADLLVVDFDHEGDLDLLLVGAFGARLWRNDGAGPRAGAPAAAERGAFTDVSAEASLPAGVALAWCAIEDLDGDADVDLLLGGADALFALDNRRAGRFVDVAAELFGGSRAFAREPVLADFDGDGRVDLFAPGGASALFTRARGGAFVERATAVRASAGALATDLDLDGLADVAAPGATSAFTGALAFATPRETPFELAGTPAPDAPWAVADLDRDLDQDLVRAGAGGVEIARCRAGAGRAARLAPQGLKDNRRAVGATIEVRTAECYRRLFWRGEPELAGCGAASKLDVVRTRWPNGAVQTLLDVPPTDKPFLDAPSGALVQTETLVGSCPFLYAWNGATYGFVTDVLGGTPLGLPMAPGVLVPPDHDEFVLVRGDQLAPRDGKLVLQITEELREVTYLDRARLDVVDHPADVAVFPNERFAFPPFPEAHTHTVRAPLAPSRATGSDGRDWTRELAAVDDVHAVPFEPLEPQFLGLATPHWLELEFDPVRVREAERLRLVCTGWFFWTDASVNVASARTPGVDFVPPILQLRGADGEWRDAGPPLGFPAGKSKTMVIELGAGFDRERPALRLVSTLRLYWDALALAVDADDAPLCTTALEPERARLWSRGFSAPVASGRRDLPERFDWDRRVEAPRWDQHPGRYTRYGEAVELLRAVDDRFAILGSGDALALQFDARALPPLPDGWARDYLLFLDGWAKDRDPNTVEALEVEPLPFHGMSGYPYGADEAFPSDPEHDAWRAQWNTREARRWIEPLAPRSTP